MKVAITYNFSEEERLALAYHYGEHKPADRKALESMVYSAISASMNDYVEAYLKHAREAAEE